MTFVHHFLDDGRDIAHVSKARRTENGRVVVDTAIIPKLHDAINSDLITCMEIRGKKVQIDAYKAIDVCKRHNLFHESPLSVQIPSGTSDNEPVENVGNREVAIPNNTTTSTPILPVIPVDIQSDEEEPMHISQVCYAPTLNNHSSQRLRRGRALTAHLSEPEKIAAAIDKLNTLFHRLKEPTDVDELRAVHIEHGAREAAVLSAKYEEGESHKCYAAMFWQTTHNPPRFITVTFSMDYVPETESSESLVHSLRYFCSCNPSRSLKDRCIHVEQCFSNANFLRRIKELLHGGPEFDCYFGRFLFKSAPWPVLILPMMHANVQIAASGT